VLELIRVLLGLVYDVPRQAPHHIADHQQRTLRQALSQQHRQSLLARRGQGAPGPMNQHHRRGREIRRRVDRSAVPRRVGGERLRSSGIHDRDARHTLSEGIHDGAIPEHHRVIPRIGVAGSSAAGAAGGTSGGAAVAGGPPTGPLHLITQRSEAAVNARERLVKAQRVLLNTLEFEVDIRPVTALVVEALEALQGAHEVLAEVAKKSLWDALKTTLPLQLPPEQLALGVLQFAANKVEGEAARRALNNVRYAPPSNWADVVNAQTLAPAVSQLVADAILALHATTRGYAGDTTSTHGQ
jgi:hypothetical protein